MLKVIALAVGIGLLAYVAITWTTVASLPADQLSVGLKAQEQAEIAVAVAGMSNRLKQTMAAGTVEGRTQALLRDDLARLHQGVDEARSKLVTLGDSPASVDQWLERIHWSELVALEAEYTKSITSN